MHDERPNCNPLRTPKENCKTFLVDIDSATTYTPESSTDRSLVTVNTNDDNKAVIDMNRLHLESVDSNLVTTFQKMAAAHQDRING